MWGGQHIRVMCVLMVMLRDLCHNVVPGAEPSSGRFKRTPGSDSLPSLHLDHGEMMEMQGFGGSPLSWQQADVVTAQESLCQSCSTAASNMSFDYPVRCTCAHDPADIHTYVPEKCCWCRSILKGWVKSKFLFYLFATHPCNCSEVSLKAPRF